MDILKIRDSLKRLWGLDDCWFGVLKMDTGKERAVCLYRRKAAYKPALSGDAASGYETAALSVLVRWGRDGREADLMANEIYGRVKGGGFDELGRGAFAVMALNGPVGLGTDEKGVYEFSIDFDLFVEKDRGEV